MKPSAKAYKLNVHLSPKYPANTVILKMKPAQEGIRVIVSDLRITACYEPGIVSDVFILHNTIYSIR